MVEFEGVVVHRRRSPGRPKTKPDARTTLLAHAQTLYRYGLTHKELARHFHDKLDESDLLSVTKKGKS